MNKRQQESLDHRLRHEFQASVQDIGFSEEQKALLIQEAEKHRRAPGPNALFAKFWNGTLELPLVPAAVVSCFGVLMLAGPALQLLAVDSTQAALLLSSVQSATEMLQYGVSST